MRQYFIGAGVGPEAIPSEISPGLPGYRNQIGVIFNERGRNRPYDYSTFALYSEHNPTQTENAFPNRKWKCAFDPKRNSPSRQSVNAHSLQSEMRIRAKLEMQVRTNPLDVAERRSWRRGGFA